MLLAPLKKIATKPLAALSLFVVLLFLGTAFATEVYSFYCERSGKTPVYEHENPKERFAPPSRHYWLGTDYQGRSVAWRAVAGSATAVKVGCIAAAIAAVIGVGLGLLAGYFGGKTDDWIVWLYSTFASMPTLLFILAFSLLVSRGFLHPSLNAALGILGKILRAEPGMLAIYLAIGLTSWVTLCRVIRAETMKLRALPYVAAARVAGISHGGILFFHLLPNVFHLVIVYFTLTFAGAVMSEVIVSYLGVGVQRAPSWGVMISDGQLRLWRGVWWEVGAATGFMFALVLALNLLGDALRDALDPRSRRM